MEVEGFLDEVTDDGWVHGWCWWPSKPDEAVEVEILADGVAVAAGIAAIWREGLLEAGIGDGSHSFKIALPAKTVLQPLHSIITARDRLTKTGFGGDLTYRRAVLADAEQRVKDLESELRLLRGALDEVRAARELAEKKGAAELFETIGGFFLDLAETAAKGEPVDRLKPFRTVVDEVSSRLPAIELPLAEKVAISICLEPNSPIDEVYAALLALVPELHGGQIEVLFLDDGTHPTCALLPTVVRNLRYLFDARYCSRAQRNSKAATVAHGRILWLLSPKLRLSAGAPAIVMEVFERYPQAGLVGGVTVTKNGTVLNAGYVVDEHGVLKPHADISFDGDHVVEEVDALPNSAIAVRLEILETIGGFAFHDDGEPDIQSELFRRCSAHDVTALCDPRIKLRTVC